MEAAFADWIVDMIDIHYRWAKDQLVSLLKIASYDAQIAWCNVKIFWYG